MQCLGRSVSSFMNRASSFLMATDLIRYDLLVQDALRSVVRKVLSDTARVWSDRRSSFQHRVQDPRAGRRRSARGQATFSRRDVDHLAARVLGPRRHPGRVRSEPQLLPQARAVDRALSTQSPASPIRRCRSASSSSRVCPSRRRAVRRPRRDSRSQRRRRLQSPRLQSPRQQSRLPSPSRPRSPLSGQKNPQSPPAKRKSCRSTPSARNSRGTLGRNRQSAPRAKAKRAPASRKPSRIKTASSLAGRRPRDVWSQTRAHDRGGQPRRPPDRAPRWRLTPRTRASSNARSSSPAIAPAFP